LTTQELHEWQQTDSDEGFESLTETGGQTAADSYDISALTAAVTVDTSILKDFLQIAKAVSREEDTKLASLVLAMKDIARKAEADGLEWIDERNKRKILIFSYFADTVEWVEEHLARVIESDSELACYRDRLVSIVGNQSKSGVTREQAIFGFAPVSTEAPPGSNEDRFDIMVSTDVLAEGQNLQQCRNIINYDLPWNPMRLVQRHGRIDRIGSPHDDVYMSCVFPSDELERLLKLEARLRRKLAQAAATIGIESEVIPGGAVAEIIYGEKLSQIEALRVGDASLFENGGEDPTAHSGEQYRQELRKGLEQRRQPITQLPWAVGSGFRGGFQDGHFFCCRVGDRIFLRFAPSDGSDVITETLACLRRILCTQETPRHVADPLRSSVYDAWDRARSSVLEEWQFQTDPLNLQPRIRPLFREYADHIRRYPPQGVQQVDLDRAVDSLEAPWGARIERALRLAVGRSGTDSHDKSRLIYQTVTELGLEPYQPPAPLPPIDADEIQLVCWMAVST
jgi:hypothetical protein